jgi:hypothetical protein
VASLHGAIAQLDDCDALSNEPSVLFGVREQEELTLIVEAQRLAQLAGLLPGEDLVEGLGGQ